MQLIEVYQGLKIYFIDVIVIYSQYSLTIDRR